MIIILTMIIMIMIRVSLEEHITQLFTIDWHFDDNIDDYADDEPGRQPQDWSPPCNTGLPKDARTRQLLSALELEQGFGKSWV